MCLQVTRPRDVDQLLQLPVVNKLRRAIVESLPYASPRQIDGFAWAHKRLPIGPPDMPEQLLRALMHLHAENYHVALSPVLHMSAKAEVPPPAPLVCALCSRAVTSGNALHDWHTRHLADAAWALATMNVPHKQFFRSVGRAVTRRLHELQPGDASMLCWAAVKTGCHESNAIQVVMQFVAESVVATASGAIYSGAGSVGAAGAPLVNMTSSQSNKAKDRAQLMWAFATFATVQVARMKVGRPLSELCARRRSEALSLACPHIDVVRVIKVMLRQCAADAKELEVRQLWACCSSIHSRIAHKQCSSALRFWL